MCVGKSDELSSQVYLGTDLLYLGTPHLKVNQLHGYQ